ncbi:Protein required for ethanol metabolism [Yamadazyma tenuis]|uniref:Protein SYM1 n=1 Tax=Candida tenuis (strain ATCC 10573 / BCRC 21748 / CBS 615 / JCM 9827 / NBRC 10315 / NRRL Y-1498 / VKM Y-70) TaxID=590646 RepID=G3B2C9_CANTC|nr:uncharacterized protein CANTEDRAFT_113429 [Yamadazyma tenuis ATCC 10573]EGV64647.1 hypothetical protein CANTEDRAFT_113429 [Yamadazyma tenuis ATCC 10573]WEJ97431.1 Protein required for ethanol metabolism [Yamadazyma tenuis]
MSYYTKYNQLLLKRPLVTNMVTTGILFGSGDFLAQRLFSQNNKKYDYPRTLRAIAYGGILFAPLGDKWYKLLNRLTVPKSLSWSDKTHNRVNTLLRVGVDQLGFAPLIAIPMYYSAMTVLERSPDPVNDISAKLREHWLPTLKTNWLVWPAFQTLNFYLVPVQLRLLSVNLISIVWNCYLSYVLNDQKSHLLHVSEEEVMV